MRRVSSGAAASILLLLVSQLVGAAPGSLGTCSNLAPFSVPPSGTVTANVTIPVQCSSPALTISGQGVYGTVFLLQSPSWAYQAGSKIANDTFYVSLSCSGNLFCMDSIAVIIAPTAAPTPVPTAAPTPIPTTPRCFGDGSVVTLSNTTYQGSLSVPAQCIASVQSVMPSTTSTNFVFLNQSLGTYFISLGAAQATMTYITTCSGALQCIGVVSFVLSTPAPPPVPVCPKSFQNFVVPPNSQAGFAANFQQTCAGPSQGMVVQQPSSPASLVFVQGSLNFMFNAPAQEMDYQAQVQILCSGAPLCTGTLAFQVSSQAAPTTSTPSTAAPTPIPTAVPTTSVPTTASPPVASCGNAAVYQVAIGSVLQFTFSYSSALTQGCPAVTYNQTANQVLAGAFQINLVGAASYTPPLKQVIDQFSIDVLCLATFVCRAQVVVNVYLPITPAPPPPTPVPSTQQPSAAPIGACPSVYYYFVVPSGSLSNSLRGMPGESFCANGRSFTVIRSPAVGTMSTLTLLGDFTFQAPTVETVVDFGFTMSCLGAPVCQGSAYITVSKAVTNAPPPAPPPGFTIPIGTPQPSVTNPPPIPPSSPQITCAGSCTQQAWKVMATQPQVWDDTPDQYGGFSQVTPRKDGKGIGAIDVDWVNGSLIVRAYSTIGNLAARFPTFEAVTYSQGQYLVPSDLSGLVSPQSTAFDQTCLANQGTTGTSMDVWYYTNYANLTGSLGSYYASGLSWYQKFGGKHVNCDTFANACRFAPLLTPQPGSAAFGTWTLAVSDCDATWTGTFPFIALRNLRNIMNQPIWNFVGFRQLGATIISEAIKPSNFFQSDLGYSVEAKPHPIAFDLRQWPSVTSVDQILFSFDVEYFEYLEPNGDHAFGLNMLIFPQLDPTAMSSYVADRHVKGFKWLTQNWISPSNDQCPTCTGVKTMCNVPMNKAFPGDFLSGDCPPGTPRIQLKKGPSFNVNNCTPDVMHVFNVPGFSMPAGCSNAYQNLTLRGVAVGSAGLTQAQFNAMTYEGTVGMRYLLDNGAMPIVNINLGLFVSRLAQDNNVWGVLNLCRASAYYPVFDPLGASTPDSPHKLSSFYNNGNSGYMCVDPLSRVFGPSGWATMWLTIPTALSVQVKTISMTFGTSTVYLYYSDAITGQVTVPPTSVGFWWQQYFPFLNFRLLSVQNGTLSSDPSVDPVTGALFAFAFTPGALGFTGQVEVLLNCLITAPNATGAIVTTATTFRRRLILDPKLSFASRYGVRIASTPSLIGGSTSILVFAGIVVGVLAVISIIVMRLGQGHAPPAWLQAILPKKDIDDITPVEKIVDVYGVFNVEASRSSPAEPKIVAL